MINRVLLLNASNGKSIDISLAGFQFESEVVARASDFLFDEDCRMLTCSAEDLVVLKAFAGRNKDWADVEGILIRQKLQLDFKYIFKQLKPLCELKEEPEIIDQLKKMIEDVK